jgi:hypothetical protein
MATALVNEFVTIRRDAALNVVGRAAPGRFVESVVQALQFITTGTFDEAPGVARSLQLIESQKPLDDGLRCVVQAARAMYLFRNKRGLAHNNRIEANVADLHYLFSSAQWITSELVRLLSPYTSDEARRLVQQVLAPAAGIVEDMGNRKLVLVELPVRDEVLVVLHSYYPSSPTQRQVLDSVNRASTRTVLNALEWLWKRKLVDGAPESGYTLTRTGILRADTIVLGMAV